MQQCPACKSNHTWPTGFKISHRAAYQSYECLDCKAQFSMTGKVSIEWNMPTIDYAPTQFHTIQDVVNRLKRGPISRHFVSDILRQTMLDKKLIRENGPNLELASNTKAKSRGSKR